MFSALKVRFSQGKQYITDLRKAVPLGFRGRPAIAAEACAANCRSCVDVCPTNAIAVDPIRIDLARCVFCDECALACPEQLIQFTPETRMAASTPEGLVISAQERVPQPAAVSLALKAMFGRSLKLRSVSAGGCNGCELELNAAANVNFDFGRYGIDWVASPRHADGLVLSGPLTSHMADALELAWKAMPDPKFVIAFGACALSGGPFAESTTLDRRFLDRLAPSLYVPGCPPHPLTFVQGLMDLLGIGSPTRPVHEAGSPEVDARRDSAERLCRAVGVDLGK